jgi:hypothetical protein
VRRHCITCGTNAIVVKRAAMLPKRSAEAMPLTN